MPEPLDYENPFRRLAGPAAQPDESPSMKAMPAEFDASVATTDDHAAVRAIEAALAKEGIDFFASDDRAPVGRQVEIFARSADAIRARLVAGQIFARRQKLKSYPRQTPMKFPWTRPDGDADGE